MQQPNSHAECPSCDGSGFQPFEKDGYSYVRLCPMRPEPKQERLGLRLVVNNSRAGGWTKAVGE